MIGCLKSVLNGVLLTIGVFLGLVILKAVFHVGFSKFNLP